MPSSWFPGAKQIGGNEMGKPLSMDLRIRALAAVDAGLSRRAAAGRFGVSVSPVIRWDASRRMRGSFEPKPQGGDKRSRGVEERRAEILASLGEEGDQTLEELRARLVAQGIATSASALSRFFQRHGITRKKGPATRSGRIARTS
jgi:transposase